MSSKHLSAAEIAEIRDIFRQFDQNNDGVIEAAELAALLTALGKEAGPADVAAAMRDFDDNADGVIAFREFLSWFERQ